MLKDRGLLRREGGAWRLDASRRRRARDGAGHHRRPTRRARPRRRRTSLQTASVVGKVFWLGSVAAIADISAPGRPRSGSTRSSARSSCAATAVPRWPGRRSTRCATCSCATSPTARSRARDAPTCTSGRPQWIESLGEDRAEDRAEMLAHHYLAALELTRAAGGDTSLDRGARAAGAARGRRRARTRLSALESAIGFYRKALELWPDGRSGLPAPPARARARSLVAAGGGACRAAGGRRPAARRGRGRGSRRGRGEARRLGSLLRAPAGGARAQRASDRADRGPARDAVTASIRALAWRAAGARRRAPLARRGQAHPRRHRGARHDRGHPHRPDHLRPRRRSRAATRTPPSTSWSERSSSRLRPTRISSAAPA